MSFVHLHVHSQYSLLEATCTLKDLTKKAKAFDMPAVALTDYGNMFGAIEFYFAARDAGVNPVVGLEVYLSPKGRKVKGEDKEAAQMPNRRLVLLAQDYEGYKNLCRLSTIGYNEGFYYKPRVDYEVLREFNKNIICLTSGIMGEIPWTFINQGPDKALEKIRTLKEIFPERLYLEMNRTGIAAWQEINAFLLEAEKITGVPVVAANDVHYLNREDQQAQEVLICIGSNRTLQDESRFRLGSDQFYFKSSDEMKRLFADVPQALERTVEIASRCALEFRLEDESGKQIYHLPTYPTSSGESIYDEIKRLAEEGLKKRFAEAERRGEAIKTKDIYTERLEYELKVIKDMGFTGYFLIVQDFIRWAKNNGIPVGPGRGSGAGSLVAYSLEITDLDPMPYNLIFERFLNPERISMPDFDIDFCQEHRGRVIDYVTEKYGEASVSQIITFGKLQARAAIRDVGRVMGMTYAEVDPVAKLIPEKLGITLKEALETEPRLKEWADTDPKINTLLDLSQSIEGLVRHAGIHAAGVVISSGNIVDLAPLYRGTDGENVVQYDMKHAEKIGLIKFDFLGLKTLTHINDALSLIASNRGKTIQPSDIALSDPGIYQIMSLGKTAGIFQFEGEGITDLIRKAKPTCFEDIVAINALYRPGPMDMIPNYLERKSGAVKVEYLFPELEEILKETYGVVVYQEQVQLIAARIANYSLGEADMLRRAMGKKIPEVMAKQKDRFLKGAEENKHDRAKASELFDTMAEFAKYGFNKSHAAAYCVLAAQTAWLKNYYPVEFYAALLSTEMSDTDKIVKYIKDAQSLGLKVKPPDVNHSEFKFTVKGDEIFFSLGAIKGVGESAVESILEARKSLPTGQFGSLNEFFETVDLRRVNKKTVECLIKAGAFDSFGFNRAELFEGYTVFIDQAELKRKDRELGQTSLFAMADSEASEQVTLPRKAPWSKAAQLAFEKEVLGFYLSDHPLKGLANVVMPWSGDRVEGLKNKPKKTAVSLTGLLSSKREIITKKGTRMAFAKLEELSGSVDLVIFPDVYAKVQASLTEEDVLVVTGSLEKEESEGLKIIVEDVKRAEDWYKKAKRVVVAVNTQPQSSFEEIKRVVEKHPGAIPVTLRLNLNDLSKSVDMDVSGGISASGEFLDSLSSALGSDGRIEVHLH